MDSYEQGTELAIRWGIIKTQNNELKKKINIEDVKRAYFAGFEKNSEIANERLNSWHWQKAAEAFQEWLEKELLAAESVKK